MAPTGSGQAIQIRGRRAGGRRAGRRTIQVCKYDTGPLQVRVRPTTVYKEGRGTLRVRGRPVTVRKEERGTLRTRVRPATVRKEERGTLQARVRPVTVYKGEVTTGTVYKGSRRRSLQTSFVLPVTKRSLLQILAAFLLATLADKGIEKQIRFEGQSKKLYNAQRQQRNSQSI